MPGVSLRRIIANCCVASRSQAFSEEEKAWRTATCSSGMCWSRYHEPQYHNIAVIRGGVCSIVNRAGAASIHKVAKNKCILKTVSIPSEQGIKMECSYSY